MIIRTTTDPITLNEVPDPELHPHVRLGDENYGMDIYFESEENKRIFLNMETGEPKVIEGNDTDDYIPEG